nr:hypothetical protein [Conexivisphaera calida]
MSTSTGLPVSLQILSGSMTLNQLTTAPDIMITPTSSLLSAP